MGYNLYIGEAAPDICFEDRSARMGVEVVDGKEFGAPLNSSENYTNYCYPGYGTWRNFCGQVGLYSVFYAPECPGCHDKPPGRKGCDLCIEPKHGGRTSVWWTPEGKSKGEAREGLMDQRPGCAALTEDHYIAFTTARQAWLNLPEETREAEGVGEDGADWVLRRLDWLCFWTRWALDTCEYPSFANS
jgi:hypothetical protein